MLDEEREEDGENCHMTRSPAAANGSVSATASETGRAAAGDDSQGLLMSDQIDGVDDDAESAVQHFIDECGFGVFNKRLFIVCGIGWAADVAEIFSGGLLLPVLSSHFGLGKSTAGLAPAMTMFGMLLGSWLWGAVGDVIGRRRVFLWTAILTLCSALFSAAAPTFGVFVTARFLMGLFLGGNLPVGFALFLEFTPVHQRDSATIWLTGFSVVGTLFATIAGALMLKGEAPTWRLYVISLGSLSALTALLVPFVPESPRFLIVKGHHDECVSVLERVADINKTKFEQRTMDRFKQLCEREADQRRSGIMGNNHLGMEDRKGSFCVQLWLNFARLFQGPGMFMRTTLMAGVWLFSGFGFYSFATWAPTMLKDAIGDDAAYDIITVTTVFQFFSLWAAVQINRLVGPALALAFFLGMNAIAALLFWALPATNITGFITYGIFNAGSAGYFAVLYLFTNLTYETKIRTTGFGFLTAASRIGGILAPVLGGFLYDRIDTAACIVFSASYVLASLLTLVLHSNLR